MEYDPTEQEYYFYEMEKELEFQSLIALYAEYINSINHNTNLYL